MSRYRPLGWSFIRIPHLPVDAISTAFSSNETMRELSERSDVAEALRASAPESWARLSKNDRTLFRLLSRMSHRTVPFGRFGAVALLNEGDEDKIVLAPRDQSTIVATPRSTGRLVGVELNPSLLFRGTTAHYFYRSGETMSSARVELSKELIEALKKNLKALPDELIEELLQIHILRGIYSPETSNAVDATVESHNLEVRRNTTAQSLSKRTIATVEKVAELVLRLDRARTQDFERSRFYANIAAAFSALYEYREVPLLELFEPGSAFLPHLEFTFEPPADKPGVAQVLYDLIENDRELHLTAADIDRLAKQFGESSAEDPATLFATIEFVEGERIYFKALSELNPAKYISRAQVHGPDFEKVGRKTIRALESLEAPAKYAEIRHLPSFEKGARVFPKTKMTDYNIVVDGPSASDENSIPLSDLLVSVRGGKLRLRSRKLGFEIRPFNPSLYNFDLDSHPIFKFLAGLDVQLHFRTLAWTWGSIQGRTRLPRVVYGDCILMPALWQIQGADLADLKSQRPTAVASWFSSRGFSTHVTIQISSGEATYKLQQEIAAKDFLEEIVHHERLIVTEELNPAVVSDAEGVYHHDIQIPFVRKEPKPSPVQQHQIVTQRVFPPGSEWTYLKIYVSALEMDRIIAEKIAGFAKGDWFYLRYADPDPHLRFRMKNLSPAKAIRFAQSISPRFTLETYEREIERYGGLKGTEVFESLSHFDSVAAVEVETFILNSSHSRVDLWKVAAVASAFEYLKALGLPKARITALPLDLSQDWLTGLHEKIRTDRSSIDEINAIFKIYARRTQRQKRLLTKHRSLKLETTLESYLASLIHVSFVRLDLQLTQTHESSVVRFTANVLASRKTK